MDAITVLKHDHKTVDKLFKESEKATKPAQQCKPAQKVIEDLFVHAATEDMLVCPAVRNRCLPPRTRCWSPLRSATS